MVHEGLTKTVSGLPDKSSARRGRALDLAAGLCAVAAALPTLLLWAIILGPVPTEPTAEEMLSLSAGAGGFGALGSGLVLAAAALRRAPGSGASRPARHRRISAAAAASAALCLLANLMRHIVWDTDRIVVPVLAVCSAAVVLALLSAWRGRAG